MAIEADSPPASLGSGFTEKYVDADGFHIRYLECGAGTPLVHFHGGGGLRISPVHEMLAATNRVLLFEIPGFGQSPTNERSQSSEDLARTLVRAVQALGIEKLNLMGISFGGRLALWFAIIAPDLVEAMVLIAPAALGPTVRTRNASEHDANLLYAHPERQPKREASPPDIVDKQQTLVRRVTARPAEASLEAHFDQITLPVLVLFGTRDQVIPSTLGRIYREKIPNCHLVLVYDAGHAIDADRPEAVVRVVGDFLERHEAFVVNRENGLITP